MPLFVHIFAGAIALLSGFVALYSAKGALLHRRSGMVFVYAMLLMSVLGASIAAFLNKAPGVNVPAAMLTAYLVVTGLRTVHPVYEKARSLDIGLLLIALSVAVMCLVFGIQAIANGGKRLGIPAFPFCLFAIIGTLASIGDVQVLRSGALRGPARIVRHLWRMAFAMLIATMSFFLGQAKVFPKPIRIPALLALPVVAVLGTLLYWLWRVRIKRSVRGFTIGGNTESNAGTIRSNRLVDLTHDRRVPASERRL